MPTNLKHAPRPSDREAVACFDRLAPYALAAFGWVGCVDDLGSVLRNNDLTGKCSDYSTQEGVNNSVFHRGNVYLWAEMLWYSQYKPSTKHLALAFSVYFEGVGTRYNEGIKAPWEGPKRTVARFATVGRCPAQS
jgi:hypothetical protein